MKKIDLTKRVTIVSTGKSIYMPEKGKEYNVSPLHAETLVKSGKATYKTKVANYQGGEAPESVSPFFLCL